MVVGRGHFDHIGATDIQRLQPLQYRENFRARRPAGDRRAGAGRKGRVQAIDVEGEVGGRALRMFNNRLGNRRRRHVLDLMAIDDAHAAIVRRMGADADLNRFRRVDDAVAHGAADEGAMVDALAVVEPGVLMGVELHHGQRPVLGGMGFQERPGDEMVAAKRQQEIGRRQQLGGFLLDGRRRLPVIAVVEQAVAVIDHRHLGEEIAAEGVLRIVVEDGGGAPDRLRSETGAGAIGGGGIEGNAPDDRIRALHLLGVFAAHEGQRAGIGRVGRRRGQGFRGECMVDRLGHFASRCAPQGVGHCVMRAPDGFQDAGAKEKGGAEAPPFP